MAVSSNAITLAEYAKLSTNKVTKKIVWSLHQTLNVITDIPLKNRKVLTQAGMRYDSTSERPTVAWKKVNQEPDITKGSPSGFSEEGYLVRNQFQVDDKIVNAEDLDQDLLQLQFNQWLREFEYDFNYKFFNNSHTQATGMDLNAPVGLRARLDNPTQFGVESELKIDGGGVDMSTAMTATTANTMMEILQQVQDYMGGAGMGRGVFYVNDTLKRRLGRAARMMGEGAGFSSTKDNYDRVFLTYNGWAIKDVGRRSDQTSRVISTTETADGTADTGSTYTSLYGVRYGDEYFRGWQWEELELKSLGKSKENGVMWNSIIDWLIGYFIQDTRSFARVYDIKVA